MSVVADFLKGTVSESLKKLVQPAGLVPATILVLFNLAFLYPAAQADGVPVAMTFAGLDEKWQVVVTAVVILAIGYLLLHAANWIVAVLGGQTWRSSGLNWLLRTWQLRQRRQLTKRLEHPRRTENEAALRWELATRFPTVDPPQRYIQPTRLGNTLVATQHIIRNRYGIDMTALWSQMESTDAVKDSPAIAAVREQKATLDLLANLVFVLALFTVEAVLYFGYRERWDSVLTALLVLPLAYIAYRVADTSARSWGNCVEVAFDLHRNKLQQALGLRKWKGAADERKLWEDASEFFLPGSDQSPTDLFEDASPSLALTSASSLEVKQVKDAVVDGVVVDASAPGESAFTLRAVEYLFIVSRTGDAARYADADVLLHDTRVARIGTLPTEIRDGSVEATARDLSSGDGSRLQWRVTGLQEGASLTLAYRLPLWRLIVLGATDVQLARVKETYRLAIVNGGGTAVTLMFECYSRRVAPPTVLLSGDEMDVIPTDSGFGTGEILLPDGNPPFWLTLPKEQRDDA